MLGQQVLGRLARGSMVLGALLGLSACRAKPTPEDLSSLRRSGEVSFVCVGPDQTPAPLIDCPVGGITNDYALTVGKTGYELHALITQTLSAEVAVARVTGSDTRGDGNGKVLDVDPSNPGVTPLRIGAQPVDIVTTPGGSASFVTVAEPGREGIFGLPTKCMFAPEDDEERRDLTTWPACRLPSTPGAIEMLVDNGASSGGADYCGAGPSADLPYATSPHGCSVDLGDEDYQVGRRKLVVALPYEGKLVVIDAQDLLDREPGSYGDCLIEAELPLQTTVPSDLVQPLPDDMVADGGPLYVSYPAIAGSYESRPADFDLRDGRLAVADRASPLVHLIDVRDPCSPVELPPLVATSYDDPTRVVTTSRVAQSPPTQSGERFIYAVDEVGDELASIVPFDVSPTASSKLPMLRPGSSLLRFEAPDRLQFSAPVKDVSFMQLQRPIRDPVVGEAITGVACNPDPRISEDSIGALYRTSSNAKDSSASEDDVGASPAVLRGTFAYALLSSGRLMVIDIEDLDAACRRPHSLNSSDEMDFRGCSGDPSNIDYYTLDQNDDGVPTVSDEESCRVVVPHRTRSARFVSTIEGSLIQAPSVRAFAKLSLYGQSLALSRLTDEGKRSPILLGADFKSPDGKPAQAARVYVGSRLYQSDDLSEPLDINPNTAERAVPVLPYIEPRAYPATQVLSVTYEGTIDQLRTTGVLGEPSNGAAEFSDSVGKFCERGVQGRKLTAEMGSRRFGLASGALSRFTERYNDYLQVANLLYDDKDDYWSAAGASCGENTASFSGRGYALCDSVFGIGDEDDLYSSRDLSVLASYDERLMLSPRDVSDSSRADDIIQLMRCCFPGELEYRLRGGHQWIVRGDSTGFEHPVIVDESSAELACIYDESPLAEYRAGRALELSSISCDSDDCGVGPFQQEDVVCGYDSTRGPVRVGGVADSCIFNSLTARFAIYRGLDPSIRDMAFGVEVIGGFQGQGVGLGTNSTVVLPVSMTPLYEGGIMGVVDSQNHGLLMVDLPRSSVAQTFY